MQVCRLCQRIFVQKLLGILESGSIVMLPLEHDDKLLQRIEIRMA